MVGKYKGKLLRPSSPELEASRPGPAATILLSPEQVASANDRYNREREAHQIDLFKHHMCGMAMLCEHYGLADETDPTVRYFMLALRLAIDHVPYFKDSSIGRPPASDIEHLMTWAKVQRKFDELNGGGGARRYSLAHAMRKTGITASRYYRAKKSPLTSHMAALRVLYGPEGFWQLVEDLFGDISRSRPRGEARRTK